MQGETTMAAYIKNMKNGKVWTGDEWANPNEQGVLSAAAYGDVGSAGYELEQLLESESADEFADATVVESVY
jgi:hypothetical protein